VPGDSGPGNEIQLETRYGVFHYVVSGTRVISPSDGACRGGPPAASSR